MKKVSTYAVRVGNISFISGQTEVFKKIQLILFHFAILYTQLRKYYR